MGTPRYMAPEQIKGELHPATDQYALGILAFELLAGTTLFESREPMEILFSHSQGQLPDMRAMIVDLSPSTELVLKRMLSLNPGNRFSSVSVAVSALEGALSQVDGDATEAH